MVDDWQKKVIDHLKAEPGLSMSRVQRNNNIVDPKLISYSGKLLIFDTLNPLCVVEPAKLTTLLQSFITPSTSVLAVYSTDIPHPPSWDPRALYTPLPSQLLRYLATTIITMHSLDHIVGCKAARERSHAEPAFGLGEGVAGVIQSHAANYAYGVVLEMDHRRKSGRDVREWYFLPSPISSAHSNSLSEKIGEVAMLLADHPLCATSPEETPEGVASTFALGLTGKQKSDRDGVVLPYFDAQKGDGEGGRILYDMGSEDDFDEEEDEI